jgi:hypothetical protein
MLPFEARGNRLFYRARHRSARTARALAVLTFLLLQFASPARAQVQLAPETLPTNHPVWMDLESLWNRGALSSLPLFTRPLVREDIARAFLESAAERPEMEAWPAAVRVRRVLARELRLLGDDGAPEPTPPLLTLEEGGASLRVRSTAWLFGHATDENGHIDEGTRGGMLLRADLSSRAHAAIDVVIERILDDQNLGDSIVKGSDWYFNTNLATLTVRAGFADVALGLDRHRWGPGDSGTLLLSDAAPPFPQFFFGRTFGKRARFAAITGGLHEPSGNWFSAHRLEIAILPGLHLGLHEAAAYPSDGIEILYAVNVIPYTIVQRILDRSTPPGEPLSDHRNNLMAGADLVWRAGAGIRFDAELLLDEIATESASQPDRLGYQLGASWAGSLLGRSADLRAEATKVYQDTYAVEYGANFLYDGIPLGYARAPDVEFYRGWADADLGDSWRGGLGLDVQRHGEGRPGDFWDSSEASSQNANAELTGVVETDWFPHVRVRAIWRDVLDCSARAGARIVTNEANEPGRDATGPFAEIVARWEW